MTNVIFRLLRSSVSMDIRAVSGIVTVPNFTVKWTFQSKSFDTSVIQGEPSSSKSLPSNRSILSSVSNRAGRSLPYNPASRTKTATLSILHLTQLASESPKPRRLHKAAQSAPQFRAVITAHPTTRKHAHQRILHQRLFPLPFLPVIKSQTSRRKRKSIFFSQPLIEMDE